MKNYKIIFSCNISENKQLVLSQDLNTDNFVLAHCYIVNDNGKTKRIFQKGVIDIDNAFIGEVINAFNSITSVVEE